MHALKTKPTTTPRQPTKPIIVTMIAFSCMGGLLAFSVPLGMLMWLNDQYKMASATDIELAEKARRIMELDKLPENFVLRPPTFSISHENQGGMLVQDTTDGTNYYFEKKDVSKLPAVQKRMTDKGGIGDHFTVKESGKLPVAGKTLEFVRGISQRDSGAMYNELHGFVRVNDRTIVEVATGTPDAARLDMARVTSLLDAIKSFTQ
jgi:hypothetical protein